MADVFEPIAWTERGSLRLLDQTRLPGEEVYLECRTVEEVARAIRTMQVRGAPAIGIAAAMGMALGAAQTPVETAVELRASLDAMGALLCGTRPTAVNLAWAVSRMLEAAHRPGQESVTAIRRGLAARAQELLREDLEANRALGRHGQALVPDPAGVLTHCNAGGLATAGYGTAVGVIRAAVEAGKRVHVWVDETRPLLQGARLTAWELTRLGIDATLITDSMAGAVMRSGRVALVIVGADRVARNGDVANKIGTYGVAVLARHHGIPFYVAAPISTLDLDLPDGGAIPIEERSPDEVTHLAGSRTAPDGVRVYNPAFDVTPAALVEAIVTERGIATPPYEESLLRLAREGRRP
ncbi:MAG: S-methyl-5-thioribose-1-phosphate isomerase [Candidatus Methylomirabilota bacterium]